MELSNLQFRAAALPKLGCGTHTHRLTYIYKHTLMGIHLRVQKEFVSTHRMCTLHTDTRDAILQPLVWQSAITAANYGWASSPREQGVTTGG